MSYAEKSAYARAMYLGGHPQKDIAHTVGVSENTICSWKSKQAWPEPPTEAAGVTDRKTAFRLYREGKSQQEIAKLVGVSENTICTWKKENNWVARLALLRDKALDEALAQVGEVVQAHVTRLQAGPLPRQADALQWAFAYIRRQLDRGDGEPPVT